MPQGGCNDSKSLCKADTKFWDFNCKQKPPEDWKEKDLSRLYISVSAGEGHGLLCEEWLDIKSGEQWNVLADWGREEVVSKKMVIAVAGGKWMDLDEFVGRAHRMDWI